MIRKHVEPVYPSRARREGTEGYVDLRITVSKAGDVKDVQVSGAEPKGLFDDAAVTAAKRWKIEPKKIDGETYEQLLAVKLRFRLEK